MSKETQQVILHYVRRDFRRALDMLESMHRTLNDPEEQSHYNQLLADLRNSERVMEGLAERLERG